MGKSLIIVESPAKAATIAKYLGGEFVVEASAGHVKDLPQKTLGVDVKRGFAPRFEVVASKRKYLEKLKKAAAAADAVYLAPDPDREGEAIAWHIAEEIRKVQTNVHRVLFHEITRDAVRKALSAPRDLDERMVESQLARRILDRLVGYQISPLLWRKVQTGLSAGRVQSVAVRLIVEREREIAAFVPVEYWVIEALLDGGGGRPFRAVLRRLKGKKAEVRDRASAEALIARLRPARFEVAKVERKERKRPPPPPFITSTLQQEASRLLHFSPSHTMAVAQRLYEGIDLGGDERVGLITYMRTDSVRNSAEAVAGARDEIVVRFGPEYLPQRAPAYRNRKSAQDAHEAIRPTAVTRNPSEVKGFLDRDELRLYSLIFNRFLACQMNPAVYDQTVVDIAAADAEFRATGSVLKFDGYLAAWRHERAENRTENGDEDFAEDARLPPALASGQPVDLEDLKGEQRFTEPPPRFSEATLVHELEERGIGRPSTYATIVSTIQSKGYVRKEEGKLRPSLLGRVVNDLLVQAFADVVDYEFTARMENELDEVEEGRKGRLDLLSAFYKGFEAELKQAETSMRSLKSQAIPAGVDCGLCGKPMLVRFGRNGPFFGCSGYPDCRGTREAEEGSGGARTPANGEQEAAREMPDLGPCPKCGGPLSVKTGRFGKFIACSSYPRCRFTRPFTLGHRCPVQGCEGLLTERQSRRGKRFFSCSNYPACRFATGREPVSEQCPSCGAPTLFARGGPKSRSIACLREGCKHVRKVESDEPAAAAVP